MLSSAITLACAAPQVPQVLTYDALLCTDSNMVAVVVQAAWVALLQLLKAC